MKKKYLLVLSVAVVFFTGCISTKELIARYKPEIVPAKDETLIYVIRKTSMIGALGSINVGCNDKYIGELTTGTYLRFKVKAGINTVSLFQGVSVFAAPAIPLIVVYTGSKDVPLSFTRVDNRSGESVYLLLNYLKGTLGEIDSTKAIPFIARHEQCRYFTNPGYNPTFQTALLNPGIVDSTIMQAADSDVVPDRDSAVVTFYRQGVQFSGMPLGIWLDTSFIGSLSPNTFFRIKLPAGKHVFRGHYFRELQLEANVMAGYCYYVNVFMSLGWTHNNLNFQPVKNDFSVKKMEDFLRQSSLKQVTFNYREINSSLRERLDQGFYYVKRLRAEGKSEHIKVLKEDDGKRCLNSAL